MLEQGRLFSLLFLGVFAVAYSRNSREYARRARMPFRRLAAIRAIDEAVGRATEMGQAVHFTPGRGDLEAQTFAGLDVLSYVAGRAAASDTRLIVTSSRANVYPIVEETVRQAHVRAGKVNVYQADTVRYLSEEQSSYVAGVIGLLEREGVAANMMVGRFWAESLQIAEAANRVGAVQIAGTAEPSQIPFLVVACDFTLISEEIFAAGTYLNPDAVKVGCLMAQDVAKYLTVALIVAGSLLLTLGSSAILRLVQS